MHELKMRKRWDTQKGIWEQIRQLHCPDCKIWGDIDDDQYNGRISVLCQCGYHVTINFKAEET